MSTRVSPIINLRISNNPIMSTRSRPIVNLRISNTITRMEDSCQILIDLPITPLNGHIPSSVPDDFIIASGLGPVPPTPDDHAYTVKSLYLNGHITPYIPDDFVIAEGLGPVPPTPDGSPLW